MSTATPPVALSDGRNANLSNYEPQWLLHVLSTKFLELELG